MISTLGFPVNFQSCSTLSNPAAHNHPYTVSPNHSAFTGIIFALGATPVIVNFPVLL